MAEEDETPTETETVDAPVDAPVVAPSPTRANKATKPGDTAVKPGFRSPANRGSKAVAAKKKKKKGKR